MVHAWRGPHKTVPPSKQCPRTPRHKHRPVKPVTNENAHESLMAVKILEIAPAISCHDVAGRRMLFCRAAIDRQARDNTSEAQNCKNMCSMSTHGWEKQATHFFASTTTVVYRKFQMFNDRRHCTTFSWCNPSNTKQVKC